MPLCFVAVGIGAGQQEAVVGELGLGGPHLLAVDDPLVAVEHGRRLERGEVRAGVRARRSPGTSDISPVEDLRQELLLLLLGAPLQDRRPDERVAEEVGPQRRLGPGELLGQHDVLHGGRGPCRRTPRATRRRSSRPRSSLLGHSSLNCFLLVGDSSRSPRRTSPRAGAPPARPGSPCGTPRPRADRSGPCPHVDRRVKYGSTSVRHDVGAGCVRRGHPGGDLSGAGHRALTVTS